MLRKLAFVWVCMVLVALTGCKKNPPKSEVSDVGSSSSSTWSEPVKFEPVSTPAPTYAPAPAAPAASAPAMAGNTYTVQPKDTLWSIAVKVYGDGKKWKQIADANGISDPKKLSAGQKLTIP
jgi:nucleoid-associated protein YgaU